jgi:RNA-binding protein Musashi
VAERRPYDRDRFGGGGYGQNGFNGQQPNMMSQMYGGMTPAVMAQWYQRMQAYYAQAMGRGMMPGMQMGGAMMGMPNMNMQGGMPMGNMPNMGGQMMGMGQGMSNFPTIPARTIRTRRRIHLRHGFRTRAISRSEFPSPK